MKNHLNEESHPTDQYLFWGESYKESIEKMNKMRQAWNLLESAGLLEEAKYLIKEAVQTAVLEDNYNNEDFSS